LLRGELLEQLVVMIVTTITTANLCRIFSKYIFSVNDAISIIKNVIITLFLQQIYSMSK